MENERIEIERGDTGLRILYSVLFLVIASVLRMVLGVLIAFELLYTLVMGQLPSDPVRVLGNRIVAYYYRIARYLTYNESGLPFPFTEFPPELEPPCAADAETWGQEPRTASEEIDED